MPAVVTESKARVSSPPRVLIVDDEPDVIELMRDLVVKQIDCRVSAASSLKEARKLLADGGADLLVIDLNLPDGDGISLLPALHDARPTASAIVITGRPSLDGAISAIRSGAIDFVPKPFSAQHIIDRVRAAIERQGELAKREKRVDRLRDAVRRLNDSRKTISKKVDLLCNDLVGAYGELSRQIDTVRHEEGFRKQIAKADDLEQLLCHSMDWLLRQIGYSNVAVYLAADDGVFQLGAYMKYTVSGEPLVTDALRRVMVPLANKNGLIHLRGRELADRMSTKEMENFHNQDLLAVNCTYLGESLASLVFFRDERAPFTDDDMALLKQIGPVFAVELATIVRETQGQTPFDDADFGGDTKSPDPNAKKKPPKKDPADWWKRGEQPPF
ncbi:MAG TPA: response regulator [Tepidisphaeraceae bacterium]|jgi:FixJ family two-component response regulator|nr:response regulator [Tepidisphaeraceae bacterium]